MPDPIDDDDIDRAYRGAVETTTDLGKVRRRRGAVLEAVEGPGMGHETPVDRPNAAAADGRAANEAQRYPPATWWRGVAAVCVIGTSIVVVMHVQNAPVVTVEARLRQEADRALEPAGESTVARDARAATRQSGLATAPAPAPEPAPAIVAHASRRALIGSIRPATGPGVGLSGASPEPSEKAVRSAIPAGGNDSAVPTGRVGPSGAAANAMESAGGDTAVAATTSTPVLPTSPPERPERSMSRTAQASASSREGLGATAARPPSYAAAEAGDAVAKTLPSSRNVARAGTAALHAPVEGLLAAVARGEVEAARAALQTTAPDAERDADGRTALAIAVLRADLPLVKLLVESGASRHAVDRYGQTPLSYAQTSGDTTMLQVLQRP